MKAIIRVAVIAAALSSGAQSSNSAEIYSVRVAVDGAQTFRMRDGFQNVTVAPCATSGRYAILDENSAAGRAQMALLVFASSLPTDTVSFVRGLGTCTRLPDHEDVDYIQIN